MARELGASAFTHGQDIFFDRGKYNPHTSAGTGLLAHELTHVVQQTSDDGGLRSSGTEHVQRNIEPGKKLPTIEELAEKRQDFSVQANSEKEYMKDAYINIMDTDFFNKCVKLGDNDIKLTENEKRFVRNKIFSVLSSRQQNSFVDIDMELGMIEIGFINKITADEDIKEFRVMYHEEFRQEAESAAMNTFKEFLKQTMETTNEKANLRTKKIASEFLQSRSNVKITPISSKRVRRSFANALKKMPSIADLLSSHKSKQTPTTASKWKGDKKLWTDSPTTSLVNDEKNENGDIIDTDFSNGELKERVISADAIIKKLVDPLILCDLNPPKLIVHLKYSDWEKHAKEDTFRAFQNGSEVHIAQDENTPNIVHEVGHYLELNLPSNVWHDIQLLLRYRHAKASQPENIDLASEGPLGLEKEGRFRGKYAVTGEYTSKAYETGSTEVMSMTMEYLADPKTAKKMIEGDPQQTAIILRGLLPNEYANTDVLRKFDKYLP